MTALQSINFTFISHSIMTLLPNVVPDPDVTSSPSTTTALLPDAAEPPDADPELPDATSSRSTATTPLRDANLPLLAKLTANLRKMSLHNINEKHRIERPEHVVEILKQEADVKFIKKVTTTASEYINFSSASIIALGDWCSVGTEWCNLKEKINSMISNSRNPNKNRPLWKLPSVMQAYILSFLSNEDVLTVSFVARGSLSTMVHQDEGLWQQRALYQLGGEQATTLYTEYLHESKPWKKICLDLNCKGIASPQRHELGIFKNGKLNGQGRRLIFDKEKKISKDNLFHRSEKIIQNAFRSEYTVEEGTFVNGTLTTGTITYSHGYKEEGTFKYGKLYGQGKRTYFCGLLHIEEGLFENGELNGKGKRIWKSKRVDKGLFKHNRFIRGKRIDPQGDIEKGTFEFDYLYQGKKEQRLVNGDVLKEKGIFHVNKLHGKGKRILKPKQVGKGPVKNNRFITRKRTDSPENTEEGTFHLGELIQGTKTFAFGDVRKEEGPFENRRLHGKGKRILKKAKVEEGDFVHGQLVGSASTSSTRSISSFFTFFKGYFSRR